MIRSMLSLVLLGSIPVMGDVIVRPVLPRATDPTISTDFNSHAVAIDVGGAHRNLLYVHLVGSCGTPARNLRIMQHAAALGFHAVSLSYPNCPAVNELANGSDDPDAHEHIRIERLFGIDATPLVDVARPDSIENRLIRLLEFLAWNFPNENWEQYLEAGAPRWSAIVFGGHSQGAGHTGYLTKVHALRGALLFGGPGDSFSTGTLAPWIFLPSLTPAAQMAGFTHRLDPLFGRAELTYDEFGLAAFAPMTNVDTLSAPYRDAHQLTSLAEPGQSGEFHGCVVVDETLALLPDGTPLYAPIWTHMFEVVLADPSENRGDMNCDAVTSVSDIAGFVLALSNLPAYIPAFPSCNPRRADINGDSVISVSDIGAFVSLIAGDG